MLVTDSNREKEMDIIEVMLVPKLEDHLFPQRKVRYSGKTIDNIDKDQREYI